MYAVGLVSLMQQFNVVTILFILNTFLDLNMHVHKYVIYASFLVFIIPNYIRYSRFKSYKQMDEKWGNDSKKKKVLGGFAVVSYVVLSTIVFIAAAHILGKIKRGEL
ncbi:MAG: hypothetical protein JW973_08780 [Bacteroidales bacterium]|nr:hypothetical protein [Bacteroidales bacterium]